MSKKYEESGVNLQSGYESVRRIQKHIKNTNNLGTMGNIGNFGGAFDLSKYNIKTPVLVSGTDGVGTKLLVAQEANIHHTVGMDLVAMCVNDVLCIGATPLFFLDYIAVGKNNPQIIEQIVQGISEGCIDAGCALIGGETAEMPDMYQGNHYDLAGYTTGVVDKHKMLDVSNVAQDDILIGLESSGVHSNGFSLVRKIFFKDYNYTLESFIDELNKPLVEELLTPTKIYVKGVLDVLSKVSVHSISHITGGGFIENIPRAIQAHQGVEIYEDTLPKLPIFSLLERLGNIPHIEMYNIFNMGIGMILIISPEDKELVLNSLNKFEYNARVIGRVTNTVGVEIV
jgi:phosphoribosylformylglycinamidine cyclo-ligase